MLYEDMLCLGRRILDGEDIDKPLGGKAGEDADWRRPKDKKESQQFEIDLSPKHGPGKENISRRIVSVIEVLESDTGYADLLAGLIDAFHDTVCARKKIKKLRCENIDTKQEMNALKARITRLESEQNGEKEDYHQIA